MSIKDLNVSQALALTEPFIGFRRLDKIPASVGFRAAMTATTAEPTKSAAQTASANASSTDMGTADIMGIMSATVTGALAAEAGSEVLADSVVPAWARVFGPRGCWLPVICN
jgi:hypothetical protein